MLAQSQAAIGEGVENGEISQASKVRSTPDGAAVRKVNTRMSEATDAGRFSARGSAAGAMNRQQEERAREEAQREQQRRADRDPAQFARQAFDVAKKRAENDTQATSSNAAANADQGYNAGFGALPVSDTSKKAMKAFNFDATPPTQRLLSGVRAIAALFSKCKDTRGQFEAARGLGTAQNGAFAPGCSAHVIETSKPQGRGRRVRHSVVTGAISERRRRSRHVQEQRREYTRRKAG